ncbi:MAG: hypothetical protein KGN34_03965 [Sphingomonadales bacterium]|nr:hypothetical protein [Sphingomonadales bacterium]
MMELAVATGLMFASGMAGAAGPAFNCARATADDERAICRSADLARLDRKLAAIYHAIKACSGMRGEGIQGDQIEWLAKRRQCGGDRTCLSRLYTGRIARFAPDAARARRAKASHDCPIF